MLYDAEAEKNHLLEMAQKEAHNQELHKKLATFNVYVNGKPPVSGLEAWLRGKK